MSNYQIIDLPQGSDEWLLWRAQGVTATDSVVLANASPYKTRWRLWAEKTGYCSVVDLSGNPLVRRGLEKEDEVRQAAEARMNDILIPVCIQSTRWPWIRASLDGLNSNGEPVELKYPSGKIWNEVLESREESLPYKMYRIQVLHQMLALGVQRGWLVFYQDGETEIFEISADMTTMATMLRESVEFMRQVREGEEPEKNELEDWFIPKGEVADEWVTLSQVYRDLDAQASEYQEKIKLLKERQKEVSEKLQSLMGTYRSADYGGVQITRYTTKRINYKQMLEDGLLNEDDVARYTEQSERCRVTVNHNSVMPKYVKDPDATAALAGLSQTSVAGF